MQSGKRIDRGERKMIKENLILDRLEGRKEYLQNQLKQYEREIDKIKNDIKENDLAIQEAEQKSKIATYPQNVCFAVYGIDIGNNIDKINGFNYVLMQLTEREREAIEYKYAKGYTLDRIGGIFNVSRERVRQIISEGCRKMRRGKVADYIVVGYEKTQKAVKDAEEKEKREFIDNLKLKFPLDYPLTKCDLGARALNCLWRNMTNYAGEFPTVGDAVEEIFRDGYKIRNLGVATAKEIEKKLGVKFPQK